MQENVKKNKRHNALKIFVTFALVIVFCASLVLAISLPFITSNGVASAIDVTLPDNGIVCDNLLSNSRFSNTGTNDTYTGNVPNFITGWNLSYGTVSWDSNGYLSHNNTGGTWQGIYFDFVDAVGGYTYTFTVRGFSLTSKWGIYCFNYPSSGNRVQLASQVDNTSDFSTLSITFTVPSDFGTIRLFVYGQAADGNFTLQWSKLEEGSSFTGYVPNYKNHINDLQNYYEALQNQYNQVLTDKEELQGQYKNLLDSMDFSTFNSVDLNSTKPLIASTTMGNSIGSSSSAASYNGVSYGGYWYYRNSVEKDPYSLGLAEFDIGSTLLAGSDIKISYDALFPYNGSFADNVGVVLSFSNFGVYSSASNLKVSSVFIPASDFIGKDFIYNFDFDVNYITFGVGTFDISSNTFNDITLGYDINSSVKQGVFISNFVVKGRGSNFSVAIDNANKQGYNKGYQEGKVAGKTIGYQQGVKDQGDYTFMGLLGAVFDAPINAFKGLLNFEILGVDMTAFVSSLFALAIIVVIIKISLGGK